MGTTLTPKSLPSLVWILRSVFFLLCGLASASPSTTLKQLDVRDNEDAVFRNFEFQACSSENKDLIKTAYLNIQNLLTAQSDSFTVVRHYLVGKLIDQRPRRSPDVQKRLQTLKLFYGDFDEELECDIKYYRDVIDVVKRTVDIIKEFAFSGTYAPTIICGDDHLEFVRRDNRGRAIFKNSLDQSQKGNLISLGSDWDGNGPPVCDQYTSASMLFPEPADGEGNEDWILLCPSHLDWWARTDDDKPKPSFTYLSQYHDLSLQDTLGLSLDDLVGTTPEAQMLHELTHSSKMFTLLDISHDGHVSRNGLGLDDVEISPGDVAYTFDGVTQLAKTHVQDPIKMVRNAETIAFDAAAVYMDKCYWDADGKCKSSPN